MPSVLCYISMKKRSCKDKTMTEFKETLLREAYIELVSIKKISLQELGISLVDENLLSSLSAALETADGNS